MQGVLVGCPAFPLIFLYPGFEVVIIRLVGQPGKHLRPDRFGDEQPVSVIGTHGVTDGAVAQKVRVPFFQGFQVPTQPGPDHDAVGVNRLIMAPVPLPGANRAEEAMLTENPHRIGSTFLPARFFEPPPAISFTRNCGLPKEYGQIAWRKQKTEPTLLATARCQMIPLAGGRGQAGESSENLGARWFSARFFVRLGFFGGSLTGDLKRASGMVFLFAPSCG